MSESTYAFGSSQRELSRLSLQGQIVRPITERLLRQAGVKEGSRVLDLGCGAGDVSMLAAEMVGPSGSVVGIDRAQEAIAKAEARARESGFRQIEFRLSSVDEFSSVEPFDVVIGRCVLLHQAVPSDLIRSASRHVRPGGVIAFHEPNCYREFHSLPVAPLFEKLGTLSRMAFAAGFPSYDAAGRMVEHFHKAGLPHPELFAEVPIGGSKDVIMYAWMAETLRSLMPLIVKLKLASEEEIAIDTVEERLVSEAIATCSQVDGPIQVCAWARV